MKRLTTSPCYFAVALVFLTLLMTACNLVQGTPLGVGVTPSPNVPEPVVTTLPQTSVETPGAPPQTQPMSPLRLWIPPEIGARTEAGAQELASQIRAHQTAQSSLEVIVEQKPVDGPGGILNYLQTGRPVAPSVMPDVVAVPTSLLAESRTRELFHPLNGLMDTGFMTDIYPAPAAQVVSQDQIFGYPFASIGLTHLIYNPSIVTDTISMDWTELISTTNRTLVLPADSREGAMLGLQFYLAEGGRLTDDTGRATLEPEPLSRALTTIAGRKENLLQSHQLKTLDEAWQYFQLGLSDFMWIRSEYLLGRQAVDPTIVSRLGYTTVPGTGEPLTPLTTTWAWAVTTDDPVRQEHAADLISFLTTPENLANWSERSQTLPARRSVMDLLANSNPYYQFAGGQMEQMEAMPVSETSRLMDTLGDAVFQVLTTETSPALIAEQAAAALRQ